MTALDQVLTPVRRHISELEERIARQTAVIDQLVASGQDINQAMRTLRTLSTTLALTREHLAIMMSVQTRRQPPVVLATESTG
jgi:ABC-type transporter Mla subunit MlaD